jgi:hypothetical protein
MLEVRFLAFLTAVGDIASAHVIVTDEYRLARHRVAHLAEHRVRRRLSDAKLAVVASRFGAERVEAIGPTDRQRPPKQGVNQPERRRARP